MWKFMALKNGLKHIKINVIKTVNFKYLEYWEIYKKQSLKNRVIGWLLSNYTLIISINEIIMKLQWNLVLVLRNLKAIYFLI